MEGCDYFQRNAWERLSHYYQFINRMLIPILTNRAFSLLPIFLVPIATNFHQKTLISMRVMLFYSIYLKLNYNYLLYYCLKKLSGFMEQPRNTALTFFVIYCYFAENLFKLHNNVTYSTYICRNIIIFRIIMNLLQLIEFCKVKVR